MNAKWKVSVAVVLLAGGVWAGSLLNITAEGAGLGSQQPGTADDPVVTKSYVDQQIQKALQGGEVTTPVATVAPTATPKPVATAPVATPSQNTSDESKIVDVNPGQILIAAAGTEFIVRAGKAIIYSQDSNGVADLTDGKDLTNGQAAPSNHLLSFPRDGRGIAVQTDQTLALVVMVRGGYTLK